MKTILHILLFFLLPWGAFSQARLVLNNNAYLNLHGGTQADKIYLVIDNASTNAISTLSTGGNIISEGENNLIKWNVGNSTGNYVVPWTTGQNHVKIPMSVNISSAGTGSGHLLLSTYKTAVSNMVYPQWPGQPVTHMNSDALGGADASQHVIDRFWKIDASSYAARPDVTLAFRYTTDELAGNLVTAGNMKAQRWNSVQEAWQGSFYMWGIDNGSDEVHTAAIPGLDFYENWTLVDITTPLPVELTDFSVQCDGYSVQVLWTTASEANSDYFVLERSRNGSNWEVVEEVPAAGNASTVNNYSVVDQNYGLVYYRLRQFDYNGVAKIYGPISSNCEALDNNIKVYPNPTAGDFTVEIIHTAEEEEATLQLLDMQGRIIAVRPVVIHQGVNHYKFNAVGLAEATYNLRVISESNFSAVKIVKN